MISRRDKTQIRPTQARSLISIALRGLLARKDFDDIRVTELAGEAGLHRSTFYATFADKDAMVLDLFTDRLDGLIDRRLRLAPKSRESGRGPEPAQAAGSDGAEPRTQLESGGFGYFVAALIEALWDHWEAAARECRPTYRRFEHEVENAVRERLRARLGERLPAYVDSSRYAAPRNALVVTALTGMIYELSQQAEGQIRAPKGPVQERESLRYLQTAAGLCSDLAAVSNSGGTGVAYGAPNSASR